MPWGGTLLAIAPGVTYSVFIIATLMSFTTPQPVPPADPDPVVEKYASGEAGSELFFLELRAHLEDGYVVAEFQEDAERLEVTLVGAETIILSARVNHRDEVTYAEVLVSPVRAKTSDELGYLTPSGEVMDMGADSTVYIERDCGGVRLVVTTADGGDVELPVGSAIANEPVFD